jgi:ATP-dependent DNA helicase DinG
MEDVFGPGGLISRHHPNYENRPGQVEMAEAVRDVLINGGVALVEAGTGTGKTLAYLLPALAAGHRVVVSTATKALQEQLEKKDIPFLRKVVPREFTATVMKGRSNYVCLHRLRQADQTPILQGLEDVDHFEQVRSWAAETESGDRSELTNLPETLSFWPQIDARAEICLGQKCPDYEVCFITRMRQRAAESDIVIVNHHLFCADLALRGGDYGAVLPDYSSVIFDEAHELEDVAASYFGCSASNYRVADLIQDANKLSVKQAAQQVELTRALARLGQRSDRFWLTLRAEHPRLGDGAEDDSRAATVSTAGSAGARYSRSPATSPDARGVLNRNHFARRDREGNYVSTAAGEAYIGLVNATNQMIGCLKTIVDPPPEVDNIIRRAESLKFDLDFIVAGDDPGFVYWQERRGRGVYINATPIDVSEILDDKLFSNIHSAVLTSATMTAGKSFGFIRKRLGIRHAQELIVESHFDFRNQAVLYLPSRMPDPRNREFIEASIDEIVRILEATRGRAFVLFTSVSSMRETYERVYQRVDFPLFIQGEASKAGLLDRFRKTEGAVLFGTSSFWQGVDVQGEALSCVIISKLPFAVPTDPVVAARQRYIDERGGNSFYEYSVPEAIIALKQGLGRLIRSTTDRGVLSILDPRIRTKAYGRLFFQSLPPCRITQNLGEAASVLDKKISSR